MFDNLPSDNKQPQSNQQPAPGGSQPAANSGMANQSTAAAPKDRPEPAASQPPAAGQPPADSKGVDDILAEVDKTGPASLAGLSQPAAPSNQIPDDISSLMRSKGGSKKYLIMGIVTLSVAVLLVVGWYVYSKVQLGDFGIKTAEQQPEQPAAVEQPETDQADSSQSKATEKDKSIIPDILPKKDKQPPAEAIIDSDGDGLSDEEEEALGTNIFSVDSDNDGLFDKEEVKVWQTDPLSPDTDNDGYYDGEEVKNGYNPKGSGKIIAVPTE